MTDRTPTNSIDSDHFVNFVFDRTRSQDKEVRRQMGHGICDKCFRVVMVTKMGKFKHVGEPVR